MRYLLFTLSLLFAADYAPKPKAISPAQELNLLRALVSQKHAQLELLAYREQPKLEAAQLRALEALAIEASQAMKEALVAAQKADDAAGCKPALLPKAEWSCEAPKK